MKQIIYTLRFVPPDLMNQMAGHLTHGQSVIQHIGLLKPLTPRASPVMYMPKAHADTTALQHYTQFNGDGAIL